MILTLLIAAAVLAVVIILYLITGGGGDPASMVAEATAARLLGCLAIVATLGAVALAITETVT